MGVYKEGWYGVQRIRQASRQVYSDAADYGVPVHKGDCIWNLAKQLSDWYAVPETLRVTRYGTGKTAEVDIQLMWESDTPDWQTFRLTYVTMGKRHNPEKFDGYLYITEVK